MIKQSNIFKNQSTGDLKVIKALSDFSPQLLLTTDKTKTNLDSIKANLNDIKKRIDNYNS